MHGVPQVSWPGRERKYTVRQGKAREVAEMQGFGLIDFFRNENPAMMACSIACIGT